MQTLSWVQVFAKGLLYLGMNTAGFFIHYLTDHAQRQVFLETRRCIAGRLKLEQENQRQVLLPFTWTHSVSSNVDCSHCSPEADPKSSSDPYINKHLESSFTIYDT